jgi:hypothetical protein
MAKGNLLDDITKMTVKDLDIKYDAIPDGIVESPVGVLFKRLLPNLVFFLKHLEGAMETS